MQESSKTPIIEAEGVIKQYGDTRILDGVDLKIMPGEFVILVGPSGAGKSTLIKLLIREEKPQKGAVRIAGRDITRLKPHELPFLRRNIGIVFQDYKLLPHKTVWENIAFALEVCDLPDSEILRRVPKILQAVNLAGREDDYPAHLSGGEAQRVCIGRALVHSPKIFIADEPTGNLDPLASREIADILEKINCQGTTVLLATHDKELVDQMRKRVITIRKGKIVSDQRQGRYNSC